jgi:hypothetical protein
VIGSGPVDLCFVTGFVSNLDVWWEQAPGRDFFGALAARTRLIMFDKRATGRARSVVPAPVPDLAEACVAFGFDSKPPQSGEHTEAIATSAAHGDSRRCAEIATQFPCGAWARTLLESSDLSLREHP